MSEQINTVDVPFWKRAPITEAQWIAARREIARLTAELASETAWAKHYCDECARLTAEVARLNSAVLPTSIHDKDGER